MSFISAAGGAQIRSTHVNQFAQWITGSKKDTSGAFTTTSATEYTLTVTNEDTSAGLILKGVYGATTVFTFNKTAATLNVPLIATGALAGLFSATGQLIVGAGGTAATTLNIGSAFQNLGVNSAATGLTYVASLQSLLASAGSLVGASAANTPVHIPKGTTAFMELVMNAGATGQTYASGVLALTQTAGDTFFGSAANAVSRLAKGSAFQGWVMNGGASAVTWASCAIALAVTSGDMFVGAGANSLSRVAPGSTNQYWRYTASGPNWETVSASNSVDKVDTQTGTGTSGTLTFSGVSTAYRMLVVHVVGRSDRTNVSDQVRLSFESSPSAGLYDDQTFYGAATAAQILENIGTTASIFSGVVPAASSTSLLAGSATIRLPEYANTNFFKAVEIQFNGASNLTTAGMLAGVVGGVFESTAAITLIRLTLANGNWTTTSRATLYGFP